jgi:hypothetical protein
MSAPIVSWVSRDNTSNLTNWNIGTVDAGTVSAEFGFLIWNNRYNGSTVGTTAVSTMTDCVITVKDTAGGLTGNELVKGQWVQVKVDTKGESTFSSIGSTDTTPAPTKGNPTPETTYSPVEHAIRSDATAFGAKCAATLDGSGNHLNPDSFNSPIGGFINDGTKANSLANFCELTLRVAVPETAPAGSIDFLTRVRYSYV